MHDYTYTLMVTGTDIKNGLLIAAMCYCMCYCLYLLLKPKKGPDA